MQCANKKLNILDTKAKTTSAAPKMFLDSYASLLSCIDAGLGRGCKILYKKVLIQRVNNVPIYNFMKDKKIMFTFGNTSFVCY